MIEGARFFVSGRVQGVGFRDGTQQAARRIGVSGWVRNLRDGRVEVYACGSADALGELETWLRRGPAGAGVKNVTRANANEGEVSGFQIRPTE